ncbi:MAG: DUF881 domain-containing protein [Mycobacteriales bacterium]
MNSAIEPGGAGERRRHDRGDFLSTSLLLDLTTITVDPAYLEAAGRRAARGEPEPAHRRGFTAGALLAVIGLLMAVAFRNTRESAPEAARVRAGLVARVDQLTKDGDAQVASIEVLRRRVAADREAALTAAVDLDLKTELRALEYAAGAVPVSGPGIVLRLGDATVAVPDAVTRVQDRDLQRAVNVAWAAGAEAVAVNDQRIGPLTAIRQAGESILVDYRPVTSPFEIAIVGDATAMETAFTLSSGSRTLRAIARNLGFAYNVERKSRIVLASSAGARPSVARPVGASNNQERSPAP